MKLKTLSIITGLLMTLISCIKDDNYADIKSFKINVDEFDSIVKAVKRNPQLEFKSYTIYLDKEEKLRFKKDNYTLFIVGRYTSTNSDSVEVKLTSLPMNKDLKRDKDYQNIWLELVEEHKDL